MKKLTEFNFRMPAVETKDVLELIHTTMYEIDAIRQELSNGILDFFENKEEALFGLLVGKTEHRLKDLSDLLERIHDSNYKYIRKGGEGEAQGEVQGEAQEANKGEARLTFEEVLGELKRGRMISRRGDQWMWLGNSGRCYYGDRQGKPTHICDVLVMNDVLASDWKAKDRRRE